MTETATAEKPKVGSEYPTRKPRHTHGLQIARTVVTPEQGLRDLLNLSCDVPLDQVFEDASAEIRRLRELPAIEEVPSVRMTRKRRR